MFSLHFKYLKDYLQNLSGCRSFDLSVISWSLTTGNCFHKGWMGDHIIQIWWLNKGCPMIVMNHLLSNPICLSAVCACSNWKWNTVAETILWGWIFQTLITLLTKPLFCTFESAQLFRKRLWKRPWWQLTYHNTRNNFKFTQSFCHHLVYKIGLG